MIRYQLICKRKHEFESWFRSSSDFDQQQAEGLLSCPHCGSQKVEKAMMAPNVATSRKKAKARDEAHSRPDQAGLPAANTQTETEMRQALKELRTAIIENSDYVGDRFATVARDMHYGDEPKRGIYGEAAHGDVRELVEEGINILPLPQLPEDKN